MGSIQKVVLQDGEVRYRAVVDMGPDPVTNNRRQRTRRFATRREATTFVKQMEADVETGVVVNRSTRTVNEYLEFWLATMAKHRLRATTFASYSQIIRNRIIPVLGSIPLQKLAPEQVQALYSRLLEGGRVDDRACALAPRSVRYAHTVLRKALQDAVKMRLVSHNVCDATSPPKAAPPQVKHWSVEEVRRFLEATQDCRLATLWTLALHTGMRRGELLGLRWQDVDLEKGVLYVRQSLVQSGGVLRFQEPKTSSGRRTIALDHTSIAALHAHRTRQKEQRLHMGSGWQESGLVFTTEIGTYIQPSNVNRRFKALIHESGVSAITFHGMRHTHATLLMANGVAPKVASERLGHAGIAITLSTYSHVLPQMQQQAAETFAAAVARPS